MITTIAQFHQTTPEIPQDILNNILEQCTAWQNEGKYTGEVESTFNPETGARYAKRWEWVDQTTAEAYKNLLLSSWSNLYPDITVDIVVE